MDIEKNSNPINPAMQLEIGDEQKSVPIASVRKISSVSNPNNNSSSKSNNKKTNAHSSPGESNSNKRSVKDNPHMGKYRVVRTLGRGNFAKVKLAVHMTTDCQVAVKVIDKTQLNEAGLRKLFREVKVMKSLNHPNIVRLYEVIESERHVYLVMECAQKGELFEHLVNYGRMREKDARVKFRQIVSALQYCHSKKIVHRDLKAENLLLDSKLDMKIADFGFSNFYGQGKKLDTFCGSPPYAAPELFQGKTYTGPEVDVWSLGVILYTLVSGSLPFDAKDLKDLREKVLRGKYRVPFYLTTECEQLLKKMLVLSPDKRESLESIMNDKWINIGFENEPLKPYSEPFPDYQDPIRIKIMLDLGFTESDIKMSLENEKFNNIHATYELLLDTDVRSQVLAKLENKSSTPVSNAKSSDEAVAPVSGEATPAKKPALDIKRVDDASLLDANLPLENADQNQTPVANDENRPQNLTSQYSDSKHLSSRSSTKQNSVSWFKTSASAGPTNSTHAQKNGTSSLEPDSSAGVSTGVSRDSFNCQSQLAEPRLSIVDKRSVKIDVAKDGAAASAVNRQTGGKGMSRNYTFSAADRAKHSAPIDPQNPLHRTEVQELYGPDMGDTEAETLKRQGQNLMVTQTNRATELSNTDNVWVKFRRSISGKKNRNSASPDDSELQKAAAFQRNAQARATMPNRPTTIGVAAGKKQRQALELTEQSGEGELVDQINDQVILLRSDADPLRDDASSTYSDTADKKCLLSGESNGLSTHGSPFKISHQAEEDLSTFGKFFRRMSKSRASTATGQPKEMVATRLAQQNIGNTNAPAIVDQLDQEIGHLNIGGGAASKRPPLSTTNEALSSASPWTTRQEETVDTMLTPTNHNPPTSTFQALDTPTQSTPVNCDPSTSFNNRKSSNNALSSALHNQPASSHDDQVHGFSSPGTGEKMAKTGPARKPHHRPTKGPKALFSACLNINVFSHSKSRLPDAEGLVLGSCPVQMKALVSHPYAVELMTCCQELLQQLGINWSREADPPQFICRSKLSSNDRTNLAMSNSASSTSDRVGGEQHQWIIHLCRIRFKNRYGISFDLVNGDKARFETFKCAFCSQLQTKLLRPNPSNTPLNY